MVELELLERCERTVAFLDELEPALLELARLVEPVACRRRLAQERARDEENCRESEPRPEHERKRHAGAAA
jgi:hypothetical protein